MALKILALAILLSFSSITEAAERHIVIGVEAIPNLPCCTFDYKENQFLGYAREVFDQFALQYHYSITYRPLPIKRLYYELTSNQIDLKFPDNPEWRPDFKEGFPVEYSQAIISYTNGIMTRPADKINNLGDVKSIAYVRGFGLPIPEKALLQGVHIVKTNRSTEAFAMALNHKVDGVFFNTLGGDWILNHQFKQPKALVINMNLPHTPVKYFASTVRNPTLLAQLNEFLTKNIQLLTALRKKYDIPEN